MQEGTVWTNIDERAAACKEERHGQIRLTRERKRQLDDRVRFDLRHLPGAADDIFIGLGGIAVTSDGSVTVDGIGTAECDARHRRHEHIPATNGTGSSGNLGNEGERRRRARYGAGTFADYGTLFRPRRRLQHHPDRQCGAAARRRQHRDGAESPRHPPYPGQPQQARSARPARQRRLRHRRLGLHREPLLGQQASGILETDPNLGAGTLELSDSSIAGQGFQNEGHVFADGRHAGALRLRRRPGLLQFRHILHQFGRRPHGARDQGRHHPRGRRQRGARTISTTTS